MANASLSREEEHRSLYTRRGDSGETGLFGSKRVRKDSVRVEAYGNVDELNSFIGIAASSAAAEKKKHGNKYHPEFLDELKWVQGKLFVAGADLATELDGSVRARGVPRIERNDVEELERMIDALQLELPTLTSFILPGGADLSAHLHVARSVCRRAERSVVALSRAEKVNPELIPFLNRLSTFLFNAARRANLLDGKKDEVWQKQ